MSDDSEFDAVMEAIDAAKAGRQPPRGDAPVVVGSTGGLLCFHGACVVDGHARRVQCRKCGVDLDPIEQLVLVARRSDLRGFYEERARLEKEIAALKEAAPKLRAIYSRLRAKVKSVRAELAAKGVPTDAVRALMADPVVTPTDGAP